MNGDSNGITVEHEVTRALTCLLKILITDHQNPVVDDKVLTYLTLVDNYRGVVFPYPTSGWSVPSRRLA